MGRTSMYTYSSVNTRNTLFGSAFRKIFRKKNKCKFTCKTIEPASFDYERTTYRVILPRIIREISIGHDYVESWTFKNTSDRRLMILEKMIRAAVEEITVGNCHDVTLYKNTIYISVGKADQYSQMLIKRYHKRTEHPSSNTYSNFVL